MSLSHTPAGLSSDAPLRDALRALPLAAPSASAWPALEAALRASGAAQEAPRRAWRWAVPAALAAGLALALLLPREAVTPTTMPATAVASSTPSPALIARTATTERTSAPTPKADDLDALHARSQRLETWLAHVASGGAPLDGQNLMAAAEVEDLISLVDEQLAGAGDTPEAAALWRQRIALLEDLGAIRTAAYGTSISGLAASTDGAPRAVPASWIN